MRSLRLSVALLLAVAIQLPLFAAPWDLDIAHSRVGFSITHMMVSNTTGQFSKASAQLEYNEADVTKSTVKVEIDVASINTDNTDRDNHLRSPDFFDAAQFPTMTFQSKSVKKKGSELEVTGDLTLHGVTKPVTLRVTRMSKPIKDPWGNERLGATATTTINRQDFGLTWNKSMDMGGVVVGDEVTIQLEVEFIKRK